MRLVVALVVAALLGHAVPARAQPASEPRERYLGSLVLADLAWIGVGGLAIATESPELGIAAGAGYLAAGPVMHAAQGEPAHTGWSIALRLGMPLVGAAIGSQLGRLASCDGDENGHCEEIREGLSPLLGAGVGAVTALAIDWAALSRRSPRAWRPTVTASDRAVSLGVGGRF